MRNQPLLNRCVHKRRKIKDTFLCRVAQQTFGQQTALGEGAGKKTGRTLLRMLRTYACCRAASTRAMRPAISIRSNLFRECASAIFSAKAIRSRAEPRTKAGRTEWVSEFSKSGAIIDGGSESMSAELVCASASERSRRSSQ
jgi:hypothetical protein